MVFTDMASLTKKRNSLRMKLAALSLLSDKWEKPYSVVRAGYVNGARMMSSVAILVRATHLCLRGSRTIPNVQVR
jgi:hypothetical protein